MTFESSASAIDGALLSSALVRRGTFAGTNGAAGIVLKDDLKVTQLTVPGVGVQIAAGVGLVLNRYQTIPNETYVTSNPGVHTIPSGSMPAANPSPKSYIVAVVVGDKDFNQSSHPWMLSTDPPAGTELTFQYVRPTIIEVSAGATTLPTGYPALPLARLDIPASTTTITNAMIVDLRHLAQPRSDQRLFVGAPWTSGAAVSIASGSVYTDWGATAFSPPVNIPTWAKRAIVRCSINGVWLADASVNVVASVRTLLGGVAGSATYTDIPTGISGAYRLNMETGAEYDVTSIAGTTQNLKVQGYEQLPASPTSNQTLKLVSGSQMIYDVRFFEE